MDYRSNLRAIRAVPEGSEAFANAARSVSDFESKAFAEFVSHHKLAPWVALVGDDAEAVAVLGEGFAAELRQARIEQAQRTTRLLRASDSIRDAFATAGTGVLFVKGLALAQRLYGDVALRHQWDIDLLVDPADLEAGLEILCGLGFKRSGDPSRLTAMLRRQPDAFHALTLHRDRNTTIDLHWTLRSRFLERGDESSLWATRQQITIDGIPFDTLSDENMLTTLLISIAGDVRRSALRAKQLLDLDRALRRFEGTLDWEAFLERQRREGLLPLAVNVLDLFARAWCGRTGLPQLEGVLRQQAELLMPWDDDEAVALLTRPRHAPANRAWFDRIYRGPRKRPWWWRASGRLRRRLAASAGLPAALGALLAR